MVLSQLLKMKLEGLNLVQYSRRKKSGVEANMRQRSWVERILGHLMH